MNLLKLLCLTCLCFKQEVLIGLGTLNINISSSGFTAEEIEKEELFKAMVRQKWFFADEQIQEQYRNSEPAGQQEIILTKFYEEYKKYLAAKWWIDTKKMPLKQL